MKDPQVKRVTVALLVTVPLLVAGCFWYVSQSQGTNRKTVSKEEILNPERPDSSGTRKKPSAKGGKRKQTETDVSTGRTTYDHQTASRSGSLPPVGPKAPSLEVTEWVNGDPVTLDELRGNVVVLEFIQII